MTHKKTSTSAGIVANLSVTMEFVAFGIPILGGI